MKSGILFGQIESPIGVLPPPVWLTLKIIVCRCLMSKVIVLLLCVILVIDPTWHDHLIWELIPLSRETSLLESVRWWLWLVLTPGLLKIKLSYVWRNIPLFTSWKLALFNHALSLFLFLQNVPVVNIIKLKALSREQVFKLPSQKVVVRFFIKFEIPAVFHEFYELNRNVIFVLTLSWVRNSLATRLGIFDFHFN